MGNGEKRVREVRLYRCGSCENNLDLVFPRKKGGALLGKRVFPALAVYLFHAEQGAFLFDTGYSKAIFHGGLASKLYCLLNPTHCDSGDSIIERLSRDGIIEQTLRDGIIKQTSRDGTIERLSRDGAIERHAPDGAGTSCLLTVILSHAHPDHIGGLPLIGSCRILSTPEVLAELRSPKLRRLVFQNLVPGGEIPLLPLERTLPGHFLAPYFGDPLDIAGDESMLGVRLPGHSRGQMGLYLPEWKLLLAADASWGGDLLERSPEMKLSARLIQSSFSDYRRTAERLVRFRRDYPEIKILFSHENFEEGSL